MGNQFFLLASQQFQAHNDNDPKHVIVIAVFVWYVTPFYYGLHHRLQNIMPTSSTRRGLSKPRLVLDIKNVVF